MLEIKSLSLERLIYTKEATSVKNFLLTKGQIFEKKTLFCDVDLSVKKAEIIGIIGNNGVGKSTLLAAIAGLFPIKSGTITTTGRVIPLLGLGRVFQPDLTIADNIDLWYTSYSTPKRNQIPLKKILEKADLELNSQTIMRTLSSGMNARLAFTVAMQEDADIYLLDEIFAVGDKNFVNRSKNIIKQKLKGDAIGILVSHNFGLLKSNCNRIFELKNDGLARIKLD